MRILHICTGNPFTPTMYYKENYFLDANLADGHEPIVLADTTCWDTNRIAEVEPCDEYLPNGVRVIRVRFQAIAGEKAGAKLRVIPGFAELVISLAPDVILFHNLFQHGICDLKKIRQALPNCKIYGDVSTSFENSARTLMSRYVLHGLLYRSWVRKSLPYWDKIFYVSELSHRFLREMYHVPEALMELNALPAVLMPPEEKQRRSAEFRAAHQIPEGTMVLFHSGKMDAAKKTLELLRLLRDLSGLLSFRLFIAGSFYDDIRNEAERLIDEMDQVTYLGFLSQEEMRTALAACDVYLQPGSASQTAQTAICCGTPVVVSGEAAYRRFIAGNGFLIREPEELRQILPELAAHPEELAAMSARAYAVAEQYFDYRKLAARLYR